MMIHAGVMDALDRALLQLVQDEFPLAPRPFRVIGERLGVSEEEVLDRLQRLHERGILKQIAPILEPKRVGINASTLVAMRVPEERFAGVARMVSGYDAVSHNYRREHDYNLWFTLVAPDEETLAALLEDIVRRVGVAETDILNLPVVRRFKIDVRFRFLPEETGE